MTGNTALGDSDIPWIWAERLDFVWCDRVCCKSALPSWTCRSIGRSFSASQGSEAQNKDIPVSQQRLLTFAKDLGEKG